MNRALIFSNPAIEENFRKLLKNQEEIGGWLMASLSPANFPGKFRYGEAHKALGVDWGVMSIDSYVVAPNQSKDKEGSYRPWDWNAAGALAKETAKALGCFALQFHSHPNGDRRLSAADIAVAARFGEVVSSMAWTVVVTPSPLRLWFYEIKWGNMARPDVEQDIVMSGFVSWRSRALRQLVD